MQPAPATDSHGTNGRTGRGADGEEAALLTAIGCEKLFVDETAAGGRPSFKAAIDFLRPGDILAVTDLRRIGDDMESVVLVVNRLRAAGIGLQVGTDGIIPGTTYGEHFARACAELAQLAQQADTEELTPRPFGPRRGRPNALSPRDIARARRLIERGTMSVADVARTLGVSAATVYRYFPRHRQPTS